MLFGMQELVLLTKFDRTRDTDNGDTQLDALASFGRILWLD